MLRLVVFALLALFFRGAVAVTDYRPTVYYVGAVEYPTPEAACAAAWEGTTLYPSFVVGTDPNKSYRCTTAPNGAGSQLSQANQGCPASYSWSASRARCEKFVDTCPSPKVSTNGYCEPPPPCTANQTAGSGYIRAGTDPNRMTTLQCSGECEVVFDGYSPAGSTLEGGQKVYYGVGKLVTTGNSCPAGAQVASTPSPSIPAASCAPGEVMGSLNGKAVCAKAGSPDPGVPAPPAASASSVASSHTSINPDGTTTTVKTESIGVRNSDGSQGASTTTTTTTCDAAGNCSSTSDTTTTGVMDDPATKPGIKSMCEENPDLAICAKLEVPDPPEWRGKDVRIDGVSPQSGWGSDNGMCPALVHTMSVGNVDVFGLVCQYAAGIRFAVIGFAWIMAALIFLGRTD